MSSPVHSSRQEFVSVLQSICEATSGWIVNGDVIERVSTATKE